MSSAVPLPRSTRRRDTTASAGQQLFGPFEFPLWDATDVAVFIQPAAGGDFVLQSAADYTVAPVASDFPSYFTVTLDAGAAVDEVVRVEGLRTHERELDVTRGGGISAEDIEREFDKQTTVLQELRRDLDEESGITSAVQAAIATAAAAAAQAAADELEAAAGAAAYSFATKAAVEAATINSGVGHLRTAGYYAAGDGGGALYKKVSPQPGHALWIQSADGAFWEWADRDLSVLHAGAVGDGNWAAGTGAMTGTDNAQFIQDALDAHFHFHLDDKCLMPAGRYRISKTLHLGYGASGFVTARLIGPGYSLGLFGPPSHAAEILCDFDDAPGISSQGGRGNLIRGIVLFGKNYGYCQQNELGAGLGALVDDTAAANWIDPGLSANAASRYAPYAGIAIDPYSGVAPSPAYPAVDYPAFLGAVSQYGKNFSSKTLIEHFWIGGFVAGVVNQPCDSDGNGDFTTLEHGVFEYVVWAVSIGNSQARNVQRESVNYANSFCALTNNQHGRRNGAILGPSLNESFGQVIELFELSNIAVAGPLVYINAYLEAGWRIGLITTGGATETSIQFLGGKLSFEGQVAARGVPARMLETNGSSTRLQFDGTAFVNAASVLTLDGNTIELSGCEVVGIERALAYEQFAHNVTAGGLILPAAPSHRSGKIRTKFTSYNVDTGAGYRTEMIGPRQALSNRLAPACVYAQRGVEFNGADGEGVFAPSMRSLIDKSLIASAGIVDKVLTFTMPVGHTVANFMTQGPLPGDVLIDRATFSVFFVHNVNTGTRVVKGTLQNNYKDDGAGGFDMPAAMNLASGIIDCYVARFYTPDYFTQGDLSVLTAVIANVGRADTYGGYLAGSIAVGDWYWTDVVRDNDFVSADADVVAVTNGSPGSIELGAVPNFDALRKRLAWFIRPGAANI